MECPNCGYHLKKSETVCPYCETDVADMLPRQAAPAGKEAAPTPPEDPEKAALRQKEKEEAANRQWISQIGGFFFILIIAVSFGIAAFSYYNENKANEKSASSSPSYVTVVKEERDIDETRQIKSLEITVEKAQRLANWGKSEPNYGNEYIAVTLTIKNTGKESVFYEPQGFYVSETGTGGRSIFKIGPYDKLKGEKSIDGTLLFQVRKGSPVTLRYQPVPGDGTVEFILFS